MGPSYIARVSAVAMLVSLASAGCMSIRKREVVYSVRSELVPTAQPSASQSVQPSSRAWEPAGSPPIVVVGAAAPGVTSRSAQASLLPMDPATLLSQARALLIAIGFDESIRSVEHGSAVPTELDAGMDFVSGEHDGVRVLVTVVTSPDEASATQIAQTLASRGAVARRGNVSLIVASEPSNPELDQAVLSRLTHFAGAI